MVVNSPQENVSGVWIMREYGSRESWVKLLSIPWPEFVEFGNDYNLHPSNSGGTLLVEGSMSPSMQHMSPSLQKCEWGVWLEQMFMLEPKLVHQQRWQHP
ncbi:hypothetical protein CRG98_042182 [Punica granatum]|uniref:F-box associated domain-containing protein n=1 Tax=Punica granatum TaxID=22663 RepID=A0A2I0I1N8_PUNGR|nr:hypothetical protein CRG98_042182 [Punica granatum]